LLCAYDLDKHQTVYNTCGRNKCIYEQIYIYLSVSVILWLSVNFGVYCSLKKLDILWSFVFFSPLYFFSFFNNLFFTIIVMCIWFG
jgi:hypothetical protein